MAADPRPPFHRVRNEEAIGRRLTTSIDELVGAVASEPVRDSGSLPYGDVTIVFSDIEASTEHLMRLGEERWMEICAATTVPSGMPFSNMAGARSSRKETVSCLRSLQRDRLLRACSTCSGRSGTRTGKTRKSRSASVWARTPGPVIKELGDYHGATVVMAARIGAAATGAEILVSNEVHQVAKDDFRFGAPKELELNGFDGVRFVHPLLGERRGGT